MNRQGIVSVALGMSLPFIVWDMWAASNGHWGFNEEFIRGPYLLSIPLEEILFFMTVPFAMLFVWEVIKLRTHDKHVWKGWSYIVLMASLSTALTLLLMYWEYGYTRSVALALVPVTILLFYGRYFQSRRFWVFSAIHLGCFLVMNTFLTVLPIITYGAGSYIGVRIGTIPVEDFIFSFCMIGLSIWLYNQSYGRKQKI